MFARIVIRPRDRVILNTPANPRLHGHTGIVLNIEPWGLLIATTAAASGQYRATLDEVVTSTELDLMGAN